MGLLLMLVVVILAFIAGFAWHPGQVASMGMKHYSPGGVHFSAVSNWFSSKVIVFSLALL